MKKIFSLLFLSVPLLSTAQSTFNAAGGNGSTATQQHSFSIAEMAVVETAVTNNVIVTHGILQPSEIESNIKSAFSLNIDCYPNPTTNNVVLETSIEGNAKLNYLVYDAVGKVILSNQINITAGQHLQTIELSSLPVGNYLLSALIEQNSNVQKRTFKIVKTL